jgi:DNA modification methylase
MNHINKAGLLDSGAYLEFLQSKFRFGAEHGFSVPRNAITPLAKPHQADLIQWACRKGRAAIFASFGLGKSIMQLEIARLMLAEVGGRGLIIMPLDVRHEFMADAAMLGIQVKFIRSTEEIGGAGIYLTNYESVREGKIDLSLFTVASLDEASVLRSYGSKTYQVFIDLFQIVPYRFVATATPSPNQYKELIHYAGFLGIADTGQALTRFFQRDSEQANNLTLYLHMEKEFFLWLHSWAAFVQKPSDLGYSDEGYSLPELVVRWHEVPVDSLQGKVERDGQGVLITDGAVGLARAAEEKRNTLERRIAKMCEIVNASPDEHFILWHDLESERHAIGAALPEARAVYGSQDDEDRARTIMDFKEGKLRLLATKKEISGSGGNFQRFCHRAIFVGIDHKFNDFVQAIHRIHRFLQPHPCEIDIIFAETERPVRESLERKWGEHRELTERMSDLIREHGLATAGVEAELARTIGVERKEARGAGWTAVHNDTVLEADRMESDSVDLIVTSVPFGNHYEYSESYEDFGHNSDNGRFFQQMEFLTPNMLRILRPGRLACIHVKDRIRYGNVTGLGMPSVEPFHVDCIQHYRRHGFVYMGMITVVTDVVRENNQTYRLGWTEQCKDGSKMGVGCPEYVLLFRKLPSDTSTAYADVPVVKDKAQYTRGRWQVDAHAFWRSSGNRFLTADELLGFGPDVLAKHFTLMTRERIYDHGAHVAVAEDMDRRGVLPATFMAVAPGSHDPTVWDDVIRMRTLNGAQAQRNLQQHVCPLQFDIVERLINRYTNPGELVYDPFHGLGTVSYCALKLGRKGAGVELNHEYWTDSLRHLREAEREASMPSLFDVAEIAAVAS